ncbi:ABC transporter substrate-binding protein [Symbiobacterium terraclitae]|uniref:ABC transporter substrate-binding protein n=1 Tax=Symbiobacterium terraclitae TaxID=557451 RepID=UPI0035B52D89
MRRWFAALLACTLSLALIAGCSAPPEAESPGQTSSQSGQTTSPSPGQSSGQSTAQPEGPQREVQGVTDTTVKVGGFAAQSGPVAPIGISVRKGFEAYIKHVNDQGGVHGRTIDIVQIADDQFDGAKALTAAKQLVESDKVFALAPILGTAGYMASYDYFVEKRIPVIYPMTGVEQTAHPPQENIFAVQPNNYDEARILTQYLVDELGLKKIAVLWQNSDMGEQGLKGVKDYIGELGAELVYDAPHDAKSVDFTTPVLNLKQKGAEGVVIMTTLAETIGIVKEMHKQGVTAVPITSYVNADPVNVPALAGEAAVGLYAGGWVPVADPEDPNIKQFFEIYAKYNNGELPDAYGTAGFIAAELLVKGLEDAGRDLTYESFIQALEGLKDWSGIMARNLTYGPGERAGVKAFYLNKVVEQDGNIVMIQVNKEPYKLR